MESFGEKFGALVRKYRESEGIDASELAFRAFGSKSKRSRISEIETGKVNKPQAKTINSLVHALDIAQSDLDACREPSRADATQSTQLAAVTAFAQSLEEKLVKKEAELRSAKGDTTLLQQQIDELTRRAQNPEAALAEAQDTIRKLEETLTREGNAEDISEARMADARKALEAGDFSIADDIFAEIETREQLAVERASRAAFARGEIAEQEIRWADASKHYQRATELSPSPENLGKADMFAWRSGDYDLAAEFGRKRIALEKDKHGETSVEHAFALNDQAENLRALCRYDEAEPLYNQAIKIDKATIGENHPNYAIHLNNLANLYETMGRYDEAEPLYKEAIDIDKDTIGEKHPDYAKRLNNLANLYESMDRYDEAEPLYKQAIEIDKATIGEKHPDHATHLNNLANLYRSMGRYDEAEPLCKQAIEIAESTLGSDHPQTKLYKSNQAILQSLR